MLFDSIVKAIGEGTVSSKIVLDMFAVTYCSHLNPPYTQVRNAHTHRHTDFHISL